MDLSDQPRPAPAGIGFPDVSSRAVFKQIRSHLAPHLAIAMKITGHGAVEVGGAGCRIHLSDGRTVLDFGSYAVTLIGQRPPAVVDAVRRQLDVQPAASRVLANPSTAAAAEQLAGYLGGGLNRVWWGSNGSDAVDAAVKLALLATGRSRILAVEGAFHGNTMGVQTLTHQGRHRAKLPGPGLDVTHLRPDDAGAVAREVAGGDVAALLFEPVQGESGVHRLSEDVLAAWCGAAARAGVFTIADEIQCGLRRCGDRSRALALGLPVNAVLLGKPLGGGVLPISAVVCDDDLYAPLIADPLAHTATFSGHPLGCAAVPAALETIEALAARGPVIAAAMANGLAAIAREFPGLVRDVRGLGLLWAMDLESDHAAARLVPLLARHGLLTSPCMSRPATVRLLPPLAAGDAEVTEALDILATALRELSAAEPAGPGAA
jgi:putrescine aminotransferase